MTTSRARDLLAFALVLASPAPAMAAACAPGDDPSIELVHAVVVMREGNELNADFGKDADNNPVRLPMEKDGPRWTLDLSKGAPDVPAAMSLSSLTKVFTLQRTGWVFTVRRNRSVSTVSPSGTPRCAVSFSFDGTPVWKLKVSSSGFAVPVVCPRNASCKPNSRTAFTTNPVNIGDPIEMSVDLGLCTYPVKIAPQDKLPRPISRRELAKGCTGWQYFQYSINPERLKVPPDGMLVEVEEKATP